MDGEMELNPVMVLLVLLAWIGVGIWGLSEAPPEKAPVAITFIASGIFLFITILWVHIGHYYDYNKDRGNK
jgi:hypothetical protein